MESNIRACIINVAIGNWYPQGQNRLVRSLIHHGWNWDILTWLEWPNDNYNKECPYNAKAAAFEEAIKQGYTHALWLDASFWALKDPNPIMDIINEKGYYMVTSGYNCAQVCTDTCLGYFNINRDEAELMPDCSSGCLGINVSNPKGKEFIELFINSAKDGVFVSSRVHDNQSQDPRFLFGRQDQMCASVIANKLGMVMDTFGTIVSYYPTDIDKVMFTLRGL